MSLAYTFLGLELLQFCDGILQRYKIRMFEIGIPYEFGSWKRQHAHNRSCPVNATPWKVCFRPPSMSTTVMPALHYCMKMRFLLPTYLYTVVESLSSFLVVCCLRPAPGIAGIPGLLLAIFIYFCPMCINFYSSLSIPRLTTKLVLLFELVQIFGRHLSFIPGTVTETSLTSHIF